MKSHRWRACMNAVREEARHEIKKLEKIYDKNDYRIFAHWSTTADSIRINVIPKDGHRYFD